MNESSRVKTISLCIIVGNVETYIERCLNSFLPVADEVVVVRAIGGLVPDRTMELAAGVVEKWNLENPIWAVELKTGEYRNKPGHEDWPHLDDFAAARQMSFDLASGQYCFWADTDDVLEKGAEKARELAAAGKHATYLFPYRIIGKGMALPRDRMIRKDAGRWGHAVHEFFDYHIKPAEGWEDKDVVVTHLPAPEKTGSNERNLRILESIPERDLTTGLLYHLHLELALAGRVPESLDAARKFLAQPDVGKADKYEAFLNLATVAEDHLQKAALLHQAYAADPGRREALMLLANNALNMGAWEDGLSYARQMMATPYPRVVEWNDRAPAYGWLGNEIYSQALRANGYAGEAEQVRTGSLRANGGARISVVQVAGKDYVEDARRRKLWLDAADLPERVEHVFVVRAGDKESEPLLRMFHVVAPAEASEEDCWRLGVKATRGPVLVRMDEGYVPPWKWDGLVMDRIGVEKLARVLGDASQADGRLRPLICTRAWLAASGAGQDSVVEAGDLGFKEARK